MIGVTGAAVGASGAMADGVRAVGAVLDWHAAERRRLESRRARIGLPGHRATDGL